MMKTPAELLVRLQEQDKYALEDFLERAIEYLNDECLEAEHKGLKRIKFLDKYDTYNYGDFQPCELFEHPVWTAKLFEHLREKGYTAEMKMETRFIYWKRPCIEITWQ